MKLKFAAVLLAACAWCSQAFAEDVKEINFGVISTDSTSSLKQDWQPLLQDMEKQLGVKVNGFFATDYAGIIEAMRYNKVQVAWFGNKSAMEAVDRAGGEVFAQKVEATGAQGYYSLLITYKDSPYQSLDDVIKNGKAINFGNGDPNSTSGFLVPSYYVFALNKIDPKTHFKSVRSASHGTNLMAVANKQVDVATNNTEDLERFKDKSPELYQNIRVIWKSPLIPADPLVWRKDLSPELKTRIAGFLMSYGKTEHEHEVLYKALKARGFTPSSDKQLLPVRQLELFRERTKLEADANLPAAEKEAKLNDINRKLAELSQQVAAVK